MKQYKLLPDGRRTWEPAAAAIAFVLMVPFVAFVCMVLLLGGCTLMGSNGFLPY